mmetsp:Transcript_24139/g.25908  ORF Transcript_24139/g.25908 Transcript_24139/m.25908 type:complete len:547 (-) Transcript_24139:17-1657(-)
MKNTKPITTSFSVHFFPYGQGFPARRREILEEKFQEYGATIVDDMWKAKYIVVSDAIRSLSTVAEKLRVPEEQLQQHFDENTDIQCVDPKWADDCIAAKSITAPGRAYYTLYKMKRNRDENENGDANTRKKKSTNNGNIKRKKFTRNLEVAAKFSILSKLHQSMPLLNQDLWKAYCFRIVAGRLENLDFEVDNDLVTQRRLRAIKGFGDSACEKIQECLNHGTIKRIQEFENDEGRKVMKNLKNIWGIGRIGALDLINQGCKTIHDVRRGIRNMELQLDRNQLVGVDCYEDIQFRMTRSEVEKIAEVVRLAAEKTFPGMEVSIMGSYRRGKESCGDVDIHLAHPTDPKFRKTIPSDALGRIIDELSKEGKISMHLTFLCGMHLGLDCEDYQRASQHVPKEVWARTKISPKHVKSDSFYMGCLYSPIDATKRRRVDIKLYPFRERAFATLYFTGNGFFNRSLRVWANRKFNWKLSDHGLFDREDGKTRVREATTEKDIFEHLQIVYREPHERLCWDALEPIHESLVVDDLTLTETEYYDDSNYVWVE